MADVIGVMEVLHLKCGVSVSKRQHSECDWEPDRVRIVPIFPWGMYLTLSISKKYIGAFKICSRSKRKGVCLSIVINLKMYAGGRGRPKR